MKMTKEQLDALRSYLNDEEIDEEITLSHANIELEDWNRTVVITFDNMNWQEYKWLKE